MPGDRSSRPPLTSESLQFPRALTHLLIDDIAATREPLADLLRRDGFASSSSTIPRAVLPKPASIDDLFALRPGKTVVTRMHRTEVGL